MESAGIVVVVSHRAQPGQEGRAKREIAELVATVLRDEPDCAGIEMLQDAGDPTRFLLIERWSSKDAYVGPHMETPHIRAFIGRAGEFMAGAPDISFWRSEGDG